MNRIARRLLLPPLLASIAALPASAESTAEWVSHMDGMAAGLTSLLTHATDPRLGDGGVRGDDDARRIKLRQDVQALRALAHGLAEMKQTPDADPTIGFMLHELEGVVGDADRADKRAIPDAALAVAWTCMGCHTRSAHGTPRPLAQLAPVDKSLPSDVRGTVLAATRRFNEARAVFHDAVLDERLAENEPYRWERAVKGELLLDIRVAHDPRAALELTDTVLNTPGGDAIWPEAAAWRRVLLPMAKSAKPWPTTVDELVSEANRLMSEADARGPADDANTILYLKATAVVHELLMKNLPKDVRGQALAWLGQAYAGLRDLDIWSLHLVYDAACVEAAPHSVLAGECYERWHDDARAAFTGNGGGDLPTELESRDRALRLLATPHD